MNERALRSLEDRFPYHCANVDSPLKGLVTSCSHSYSFRQHSKLGSLALYIPVLSGEGDAALNRAHKQGSHLELLQGKLL